MNLVGQSYSINQLLVIHIEEFNIASILNMISSSCLPGKFIFCTSLWILFTIPYTGPQKVGTSQLILQVTGMAQKGRYIIIHNIPLSLTIGKRHGYLLYDIEA